MDLLEKVTKLEHEADAFGFRWGNPYQIMEQIRSECLEIDEHLHQHIEKKNPPQLQEEIGDLLHAAFSLCVFCKLDPKTTLESTLIKFERRLTAVKKLAHEKGLKDLNGHSFDELMQIWREAKALVG